MRAPLELLNAHFDGERLSDQEARRLSAWVKETPENSRAVVELGMVHELTDSILSVPRLLDKLALTSDPALKRSIGASLDWVETRAETPNPAQRPARTWTAPLAVSGMLLAASLLVAVTALVWTSAGPGISDNESVLAVATAEPDAAALQPATAPVVATVLDSFDAMWDGPRVLTRGTTLLRGETINLTDGLLSVTTADGSDVVVQAPARLSFTESASIDLRSGRLTARIGDGDDQLVVTTPTARVIDLGTEFAVGVGESGETSVEVYEGEVELASLVGEEPGEPPVSRTLRAGRSGYVDADGRLRWTIETLPHTRGYVRPDEIADLREAKRGSRQAREQVCFYELQRIEGLLGFQGFDIPSAGGERCMAFAEPALRSDRDLRFERDLSVGCMSSSGSLRVEHTSPVFLTLDTSPESSLARAGLLTERGMVGRSDTELWLAWRTSASSPRRLGAYAGLSLMFGEDRRFNEPLFVGLIDSTDQLGVVANVGSRSIDRPIGVGASQVGTAPHLWVMRMVFGERSDKVSVWYDVAPGRLIEATPDAEVLNATLMFDRLRVGVGNDGGPWLLDDIVLATNPQAIVEANRLLDGE
ncbi:FecR protein [Posidoniimonas polymericola]|uniref:FecR protein n=1 Tax=Posidoniimonas polymericola TaxID=2528002 RepID=A0A5C5YPF2_9BACT|nr:FecR family protein [Posidoniimonas polymericola]TWT76821.1 FecR protein [Posidoniimonas polymericola]